VTAAQRVIDDIDALVDEQMAGGEAETGYSRCRCGSMWHGLRKGGCPGSDSEGPLVATGLTFGSWQDMRQNMEPLISAFRGIAEEVSRAWESIRRTLLGLPAPQSQSRCTLAARRRMHSDQLRVQRRALRRERRARRRETEYDHPLEVHDDHVILTLTPDVSGFRRELRKAYDPS